MQYVISLFAILFTANVTTAQEALFKRVTVGGLVSLEIPSHWKVRDANERRDIAAAAEARFGNVNHVASLSVVSLPEPSGGIVRVSFVSHEGVDQRTFAEEIRLDRAGALVELREAVEEDFLTLRSNFERQGLRILNGPTVEIVRLDARFGFVTAYRRTSQDGASTYFVTQYHIPLATNKAIVTLSYREQQGQLFQPIIRRVRDSIKFI